MVRVAEVGAHEGFSVNEIRGLELGRVVGGNAGGCCADFVVDVLRLLVGGDAGSASRAGQVLRADGVAGRLVADLGVTGLESAI